MKLLIVLVLLFPLFTSVQTDETPNEPEYFTNPVWDGSYPWMVKESEYYYYC